MKFSTAFMAQESTTDVRNITEEHKGNILFSTYFIKKVVVSEMNRKSKVSSVPTDQSEEEDVILKH
jgi:hypothetical protein